MSPVYAGVFPPARVTRPLPFRCPRVRGGIPFTAFRVSLTIELSPCTRGYSHVVMTPIPYSKVVPVYAGVFL